MFRAAKWPDGQGQNGEIWLLFTPRCPCTDSIWWLAFLCELQTRVGPRSDNNGWTEEMRRQRQREVINLMPRKERQQSSQYRGQSKFTDQLKYAGYWLVWASRGRWPIRGASDEVRWPGEDDSVGWGPQLSLAVVFCFLQTRAARAEWAEQAQWQQISIKTQHSHHRTPVSGDMGGLN